MRFDDAVPTVRTWLTRPVGWVSISLLAVEFIAGMQSYVTTQINPLIASDLGASGSLGLMFGTASVAAFLTMPLGSHLLGRFHASTLLLWLTLVSIVGGVVSATAMTMAWFIAGRFITGLASGALMTVSMGTIVMVLPGRWRQIVLAGYSAMWVITSLAGPAYATMMVHLLSWRWALVAYLPFLLVARASLARQLPRGDSEREAPPARVVASVVLAAAVALVSVVGNVGAWWPVVAAGALAGTVYAASRILPRGVLRLRRGRPSAIATLFVVCAAYFGGMYTLSVVTQEVLGLGQGVVGSLLGLGGLAWAILGVLTGRRPAATPRSYTRRADAGALLLAGGLGLLAVGYGMGDRTGMLVALYVGWCAAGVGMGLVYLDTINAIVETPAEPDGISMLSASNATVQAESTATAVVATGAVAALSGLLIAGWTPAPWVITSCLAAMGLSIIPLAHRTTPHTPHSPHTSRSGVFSFFRP